MEAAQWWADFRPGRGNLDRWHPVAAIVETTQAARQALAAAREEADAEYVRAETARDAVSTTVWGRVYEHVRKLALLYAISESHATPRIDAPAVAWASKFMLHATRRMLFMAHSHAAENPFHAECLKLTQKLRAAPERTVPHSVLLKRMKMDAKRFRDLVATLIEQEEIVMESVTTAGRTGTAYRLVEA